MAVRIDYHPEYKEKISNQSHPQMVILDAPILYIDENFSISIWIKAVKPPLIHINDTEQFIADKSDEDVDGHLGWSIRLNNKGELLFKVCDVIRISKLLCG